MYLNAYHAYLFGISSLLRLKKRVIELRNVNKYRLGLFFFKDMYKFSRSSSEILPVGDHIRAALSWRTIRVPSR